MTRWVEYIYEDWPAACGITTRIKREYHRIYPSGKIDLADPSNPKGHAQLELTDDTFRLAFESFRQEFDHSKTLLNRGLTRRCDYVLSTSKSFLLLELTSATARANLDKKDEKTGLSKFEKAPLQMADTYRTLALADSIRQEVESRPHKVALCVYNLETTLHSASNAFNRPLKSEDDTSNGIEYKSPELNQLGFIYRRMASTATFTLQ